MWRALVHEHPLGLMVSHDDRGLQANHLPFVWDTEPTPLGTLRGHLARANPHWKSLVTSHELLVVFQGPQAYVSPSYYPSKAVDGRVVPTWNFAVVHVRGKARLVEEPAALLALVTQLTQRFESQRHTPWAVEDAPPDFVAGLMGAIVGVEIEVTAVEGKWKMSQNRTAEDAAGAATGLAEDGEAEVAAWVGRLNGQAGSGT